jgi:acyl carrier protein
VLDRHPAVNTSCVSVYSDDAGEKRLLAYVVPRKNMRLDSSALRKFVGDYLPEYMIPSTFVQLEQLPCSASGKLDRTALPKPTPANILENDSFEPPQTQVEKRLASLLTSLLGVSRVGREDNFFSLGGHSLMGAQLIAKIRETFGVELSLLGLFDHPTVKEVSSEIERLIHAELASISDDEAQHILESSQGRVQL